LPSELNEPPSSAPIATIATTKTASQAPTVRHGCLALAPTTLVSVIAFNWPPFQ
jgi:hypothetical protein